MPKLIEIAKLSSLIGTIAKTRVKYQAQVQIAAVACVAYSILPEHRNITPANQLLEAVSDHDKATLVAYIEKFGNVAYMKADKRFAFFERKDVQWTDEYAEKCEATQWHKAKAPVQPKSVYDFEEEAEKFIDRFRKLATAGKELKHIELLNTFEKAYQRYVAAEALRTTKANPDLMGDETEEAPQAPTTAQIAALAAKLSGTDTTVMHAANQQ